MSKLNQEELLEQLDSFKKVYLDAYDLVGSKKEFVSHVEQAFQQIKEIIQKPEVTEEWYEEKAKELITMVANLYPYEGNPCVIPKSKAKDFICSLFKEERVAEDWIQGEPYE